MVHLSVNVNKIATLRNARGGDTPNVCQVVKDLIHFEVPGITVHPRPDRRHILYEDVSQIKELLTEHPKVEFNIEGYPEKDFLKLIQQVRPAQCTLVPDPPSVKTSNAGWRLQENKHLLKEVLSLLEKHGVRSSLFVDPFTLNTHELEVLKTLAPSRAELYTEAYAKAWPTGQKETVTAAYTRTSEKLNHMGIAVNAGHDLNLQNLPYLLKQVPLIREVSIGHALICEALYHGLKGVVSSYLRICQGE